MRPQAEPSDKQVAGRPRDYAERGERKRHLRDTAWSVHVSRTIKQHALLLLGVRERLTQRGDRCSAIAELATKQQLSSGARNWERWPGGRDGFRQDLWLPAWWVAGSTVRVTAT